MKTITDFQRKFSRSRRLGVVQTILCILFLLTTLASTPAAESAAELFQKGLIAEEVNHDLDTAIRAYRAAIAQMDEQRKLAATAIYRLAECYRKQGKSDLARPLYSRVVKEFSDQTDLARLSLETSGLAPAQVNDVTGSAGLTPGPEPLTPAQVKLVQEEIKLFELQLRDLEARRGNGKASSADIVPVQREMLVLKRKLPGNTAGAARRALVQEEIRLVENSREELNRKIEVGAAAPIDRVPLDRELLALRRELAGIGEPAPVRPVQPAAAEPDDEAKEILRLTAVLRDSPDLLNRPEGGVTPLQRAVREGQARVVRFLIEQGAEVDRANNGLTPLHFAAAFGHKAIAEVLLDAKGNVNVTDPNGMTPLHLAALKGFPAVTGTLLARSANPNASCRGGSFMLPIKSGSYGPEAAHSGTPLHWAAIGGQMSVVRLLLEKGADVNAADARGQTPLMLAASKLQLAIVEQLLAAGADANRISENGETALLRAADLGNADIAQALLTKGADANHRIGLDLSPLLVALRKKNAEIVNVLLRWKANVEDADSEGYTPLQHAVSSGVPAIVEALLKAGANPNVVGPTSKQTPVFPALDKPKILELLLAHGAKVDVVDLDGKTPLDHAEGRHSLNTPPPDVRARQARLAESAKLLRAAGANPDWRYLDAITIGRKAGKERVIQFQRGTNDVNRYTLFELLARFYIQMPEGVREMDRRITPSTTQRVHERAVGPHLVFPDFRSISIRNVSTNANTTETFLNILAGLEAGDCSQDRFLEWGDIVEIPERDHAGEVWVGLVGTVRDSLIDCVQRKITVTVQNQHARLTLLPDVEQRGGFVRGQPGIPPQGDNPNRGVSTFYLSNVIPGSGVLRSSSDLTRVKVRRPAAGGQPAREWTLNVTSPNPGNDLWLRDGDVIEVPDKE